MTDTIATKATVEESLQQTLVDLIALELQSKQAHWNIRGPRFRSLHLALDELVTEARTELDTIAERLAQVGGSPDGRPETVAATTTLSPIDSGILGVDKAYRLIAEKAQAVSDRIKKDIKPVDDVDPLSSDLLIKASEGLDFQAWLLRSATE